MNPGRAKKIRKDLIAAGSKNLVDDYKAVKKDRRRPWLKANLPKAPVVLFKKQRKKESIDDFRKRRKESNRLKRISNMGFGFKKIRRIENAT